MCLHYSFLLAAQRLAFALAVPASGSSCKGHAPHAFWGVPVGHAGS